MILIGSAALSFPNDTSTFKRDFDIVGTEAEKSLFANSSLRIDWHDIDILNNASIEDRFTDGTVVLDGIEINRCSKRGLAAIKRSHLWRNYFFEKHMVVYNLHLREHLSVADADWIHERTVMTRKAYPYRTPVLAVGNKEFFTPAVYRKYDHDMLHELFAFGERPVFEELKRDFTKATCEKDLWDALSHEKKIQCAVEEVMVTAAERYMVPKDWKYPAKRAYIQSLEKLCTTMTSGWFRDFGIDNYMEIYYTFDEAPFNRVKEALHELSV
jgi:hypothetical protein